MALLRQSNGSLSCRRGHCPDAWSSSALGQIDVDQPPDGGALAQTIRHGWQRIGVQVVRDLDTKTVSPGVASVEGEIHAHRDRVFQLALLAVDQQCINQHAPGDDAVWVYATSPPFSELEGAVLDNDLRRLTPTQDALVGALQAYAWQSNFCYIAASVQLKTHPSVTRR